MVAHVARRQDIVDEKSAAASNRREGATSLRDVLDPDNARRVIATHDQSVPDRHLLRHAVLAAICRRVSENEKHVVGRELDHVATRESKPTEKTA